MAVEVIHIQSVDKTLDSTRLQAGGRISDPPEVFEGEEKNKTSGKTAKFRKEDSFEAPTLGITAAFDLATAENIIGAVVNFSQHDLDGFGRVLEVAIKLDDHIRFQFLHGVFEAADIGAAKPRFFF